MIIIGHDNKYSYCLCASCGYASGGKLLIEALVRKTHFIDYNSKLCLCVTYLFIRAPTRYIVVS